MTRFSCPPGSQDCVGQCGVSRRGERLFHCADALQGQTFIDLTHPNGSVAASGEARVTILIKDGCFVLSFIPVLLLLSPFQ